MVFLTILTRLWGLCAQIRICAHRCLISVCAHRSDLCAQMSDLCACAHTRLFVRTGRLRPPTRRRTHRAHASTHASPSARGSTL